MNKQLFSDKFEELKSPANAELREVLKLWLVDAKSDLEIAKALGKKAHTTGGRKIVEICKHFGTDVWGEGDQRRQLVLLFRKYCSDFEVHPSIYPDWVDGNSSDRTQPSTNPKNIPTPDRTPELTTLDFIGRDRDLTDLASRRNQYKIVLIKAGAGVGKSTLAREFLQAQFKKVIRIEMGLESGNVTPAEEKVSQILRKDFDEEPSQDFGVNLDILREKLLDRTNPIGVLIDNLEPALNRECRFQEKLRGYKDLLRVLIDRDVFSFTLITSRLSLNVPRMKKVHEYLLEGLDITAWRQYFHDCENVVDSEVLKQMCVAYNGNAKVMDILYSAIKNRFDGDIGTYWSRYKDALLADPELETLISVEMDWLRDNQPDAYNLLCRMGCYRYQDIKMVPFEGLVCLLWDVSESRRAWVVDYLSKTSLIEVKKEYYLHPAIRYAAKPSLEKNKIDWERANREAAKFWESRFIKNIETVDQVNTVFESYYHFLEIKDYNSACETLVRERESRWERAMKQGGRGGEQLGYSYVRVGGLLETITAAIEKVTKEADNQLILARAYNLEGDLFWLTGNPRKGITSHERTNDMIISVSAEHSVIERLRYSSMLNRGLCYLSLWEIDIAHDFFSQLKKASLDGIEQYKYTDLGGYNLFRANFCLSVTFSLMDERENAHSCIKQAIEGESGNRVFSAWTSGYSLVFIAQAYKNIGYLEEAKIKYAEATAFAEESAYSQVKAIALYSLGEIERISHQYDQALSDIQEAETLLQKIGAKVTTQA